MSEMNGEEWCLPQQAEFQMFNYAQKKKKINENDTGYTFCKQNMRDGKFEL